MASRFYFLFTFLSVVSVFFGNTVLAQLVPIASPIQLQPENTVFFPGDILGADNCLSHMEWPDGLIEQEQDQGPYVNLKGSIAPPLALATAYCNNEAYSIVVKRSEKQAYIIRVPESLISGKTVTVFGTFNAWNRNATPMKLKDGNWEATVFLTPGNHAYLLQVDGIEQLDPVQKQKVSNGAGGFNSVLTIPESNKIPKPIKPKSFEGSRIFLEALPKDQEFWAIWNNTLLQQVSRSDNQIEVIVPKAAKNIKRSFLRLYTFNENAAALEVRVPLHFGEVLTNISQLDRSDWEAAVLYSLMVDRFQNGKKENDWKYNHPEVDARVDYYGGDIAGVSQVLETPWFNDLGVNAIWLSPVTQNPYEAFGFWDKGGVTTKFTAYHGYWPISNIKPDQRFATPTELHQFLETAHNKGMNVLLDYVANHVHKDHPVYQQHPDWATSLYLPDGTLNTEKWDEHRLTTWFDIFMPTLDMRRQEVVDAMTDSALIWITEYDFDGFRHDATKHIDERFWRTLTQKARPLKENAENPRLYQIGETYGSPELIGSYVSSGMLDGQFDFNLYDAAVATFASPDATVEQLAETLEASLKHYGQHHLMGNITGNHDRPRFISLASGDVKFDEDAKLAGWSRTIEAPKTSTPYHQLLLLHIFNAAIPGIPTVYYGDEYGEPGANDPDNRRWMRFDNYSTEEQNLLNAVQEVLKMRNEELALQYGTTSTEVFNNGKSLKIKRTYFDKQIDILIHLEKTTTKIEEVNNKTITSFNEASIRTKKNTTTVKTKPYGAVIIKYNSKRDNH